MSTEASSTPATATATATATSPRTPLEKLSALLSEITNKADHREMWGVELTDPEHVPTKVVLQKFLRANDNDAAAAEKQLTSALEWRKKMQPTTLVDEVFDRTKFGDLGYVTVHNNEAGTANTPITWNIYGTVKNNQATFGNVAEFIKWRTALMELSAQKLNLNSITEPIPDGGVDKYQMVQVHDYKGVSFFRLDPAVRAASKETIQTFAMAYPELLSNKYFVNVPAIMGFMYGVMKLFVAPATLRKFHPMTSGTTLATELKDISASLPKEYGGKGPSVKEGLTVALTDVAEAPKKEEIPEGSAEAPVAAVTEAKTEAKPEESAPAEKVAETKPAEETKAVEETKPIEETKAVDEPKPADETKTEEETKLAEEAKTAEETESEKKKAA